MGPLEDLNGCEAEKLVWDVLIIVDRSQSIAAANPIYRIAIAQLSSAVVIVKPTEITLNQKMRKQAL